MDNLKRQVIVFLMLSKSSLSSVSPDNTVLSASDSDSLSDSALSSHGIFFPVTIARAVGFVRSQNKREEYGE